MKKTRILVVDDDKGERDLFARIIKTDQHDVKIAKSAKEALAKLKKDSFNLVLTDIVMPQMDGIQLLTKIKKNYSSTIVVMITGQASMETAIEALRKGAYDYIRKPLTHKDELLHCINQALERQDLGYENKELFENLKKAYSQLKTYKKKLETKVFVGNTKIREKDRDLKDAYAELKQAYQTLEEHIEEMKHSESLAAMGKFSACIVHELRNPLTSIEGFIQLLPRKYDSPKFRDKFIETTTRETERINKFVDRLLKFGRPVELNLQLCEITKVILSVIESSRMQLSKAKIKVNENFSSGLPKINIDSELIVQVLSNLINNAIHAMPEGGTLTISASPGEKKDFITITIKDTGCGIAKQDLSKIFEPFYTTKSQGTGLGLAIIRNIIDKHNGSIKCESIAGKGASFIIKLPKNAKSDDKKI